MGTARPQLLAPPSLLGYRSALPLPAKGVPARSVLTPTPLSGPEARELALSGDWLTLHRGQHLAPRRARWAFFSGLGCTVSVPATQVHGVAQKQPQRCVKGGARPGANTIYRNGCRSASQVLRQGSTGTASPDTRQRGRDWTLNAEADALGGRDGEGQREGCIMGLAQRP